YTRTVDSPAPPAPEPPRVELPSAAELAARLAGSRRALEFKKGAVCRIDLDGLPPERSGTLRWFLPPSILRSIS
ncbi:MAG: hypothetical protein ABL982_01985, partial [Vicinamibacterales bacterium]